MLSCQKDKEDTFQFSLLTNEETGLDFENTLIQTPEFNVFNYMYFFNGGGLAAGDFNNDQLVDLFFTSNMGPNKLYLNQGGMKFKDMTSETNIEDSGNWSSGATVVDINNDGLLDLYVSYVGDFKILKGKNQLFICKEIVDGIPKYEEKAEEFGLDLVGFSTQAAFFDYDKDGDLDMFQLNHSVHNNGTFGRRFTFEERHLQAGDKLLRNDDGKFVDVTEATGIYSTVIGYGLGIALGDVNLDGWTDVYIGNDFHENDYLYINQKDGTYKELLTEQIMHTSRFSMGVDMADINNDAFQEIISLDMLPYDPFILKSSLAEDDFGLFNFKLGYGYNHQYARNNLQLNNGDGSFTEVGLFTDVYDTDWSWSPLFFDFNHDGYKDLFVSNGIPRRMNDIDYINYRSSNEVRWKFQTDNISNKDLNVIEKMPQIKLPNKFFMNQGELSFIELEEGIENSKESYSNGAIYADLDNDGDLDVVVNNLEDPPFIYKNLSIENGIKERGNFLKLILQGPPNNIDAIGSKVIVYKGEQKLIFDHFATRGFQSSMLGPLHIGLGDSGSIDSIHLIWPDGSYQGLEVANFDTTIQYDWKSNLPLFDYSGLKSPKEQTYVFADVTKETGIDFRHKENPFVEFNREKLIPYMVSSEGPAITAGDINGDQLEDLFIGGAKREKSKFYIQNKSGLFQSRTSLALEQDSLYEDVDAQLIDIDNDNDLDLIVASGGNEFQGTHPAMQQRLYINDGQGHFERKADAFQEIFMTASCVLSGDFNGDGLIDLFFGGRAVPWNYGISPRSYLLLNKGNANFEDVTKEYCEALTFPGLVRDGQWEDIDQDGDLDLILALEWNQIKYYINQAGQFEEKALSDHKGLWNFVFPFDFDRDGDIDVLAGNLGLNSKLKASFKEPINLYVADFDENQQVEQILTYYRDKKEIPFATFRELTSQLVSLKKDYLYSKDLARASLEELFGADKLNEALKLSANTLQHAYFENEGGQFKMKPLPQRLQYSTLNAAAVLDGNQFDGTATLVGGNFYDNNIEMGRYDGSYGNVLLFKDGEIVAEPIGDLRIKGQVRAIQSIQIGNHQYLVLAKNDDFVQVLGY